MPTQAASDRALDFLQHLAVRSDEPMRIANVVALRSVGLKPDVGRLLSQLSTREMGAATSSIRYRWELSHRRVDPPDYAGPVASWKAWRPREQPVLEQDPFVFEERLTVPILVAEASHLLEELSLDLQPGGGISLVVGESTPAMARRMLNEADPVFRRDLASHLQMMNSWGDTFALFCLSQRPRAVARHRPLALAMAASYAPGAQSGIVRGSRFPFHEVPLVSATAQLAAGLLALGCEFELLGRMITSLRRARKPAGGFADAQEPEDVLTTLAAAQLLAGLDPQFDPGPTLEYFLRCQHERGFWRALGPEVPWLSALVLRWIWSAQKPFPERFRWPSSNEANTDRKTNIPGFTYFLELCELMKSCSCLAVTRLPFAFIDLVGFRAFNNQCGQDAGDQALEEIAAALAQLPGLCVVRDGGDEFLLIGAPLRDPLMPVLQQLKADWPARFHARFGPDVPLVRMRALIGHVAGARLRDARETLGRRIGELKNVKEDGGAVMRDIGPIA